MALMVLLSACQQPVTAPIASPSATPSGAPLTACPLGSPPSGPEILASKLPAPDDLAFDNSGRLLFSDVTAGSVSMLAGDGSIQRLAGGLSEPEGIVVQADGRILVAEQGRNRISAIDPQSQAVTVWRTFTNRTANAGIDGIGPILPAKDAAGQPLPNGNDVVVPDSPNGVVWAVSADGSSAIRVASGMTRPVGAAIDPAGHILVTDEGGAVWSLDPARHRFATLPTPDDVVVTRDGHVFVTALGDNRIYEFDGDGHQLAALSGIRQPQGLALDAADNLYYTAFSSGQIFRAVRTYVLGSPVVRRLAARTYMICPLVRRAASYHSALNLTTESNPGISILRQVQPGTDSSGALEVQTAAPSITISIGALSQTIALTP